MVQNSQFQPADGDVLHGLALNKVESTHFLPVGFPNPFRFRIGVWGFRVGGKLLQGSGFRIF